MDKLEHYLDQVCRGIGGPRSLRQHLRQELREHLLDAAAEHRTAGLSEEQALARALEDFGGPEQVRLELEATHGHRLMAVVIDKAMQWKEMTMKTKWLWTTWAHLALALVIAVQIFFISVAMIFIVPSYEKIKQDGLLRSDRRETQALLTRADSLLTDVMHMAYHLVNYWYLWAILLAFVAGLFEWRVRSENKSFMRLSALGMAAVVLAVIVGLTASTLVIPFCVAVPTLYAQLPETVVPERQAVIRTSISKLEQALAKKDWKASDKEAEDAWLAMRSLSGMGAAAPAIMSLDQQAKVDELQSKLESASEYMWETYDAITHKDASRADAALKNFHKAYRQVPGAAK
jgi:hypothetical protein